MTAPHPNTPSWAERNHGCRVPPLSEEEQERISQEVTAKAETGAKYICIAAAVSAVLGMCVGAML